MFSLEELFCAVDDFWQNFEPHWQTQQLSYGAMTRRRPRSLSMSEIMTLLIAFNQSGYRNFKQFYLEHICVYWRQAFPHLVSYQRFVEWIPSTLIPLCVYLKSCFGLCTGISFIDAICLKVCHNRRIL